MIDYRLLEALARVVREGGFERAARAMNLTQSAVSQRVKQLEEQLGQVLLVRSQPPRPTAAGTELLRHQLRVERLEADLAEALGPDHRGPQRVPVGVNADSLATWFLDALTPLARDRGLLLTLHVADQDETHELLRRGEVLGCVSARANPMQGCAVEALGCMVYRLLAAPGFRERWFPRGLTPQAVRQAPAVVFNLHDDSHNKMLRRAYGQVPAFPAHVIPSSERFVDAVAAGLGYGMVPEIQAAGLLDEGRLVDLGPEHALPVDLYWHCWNMDSPLLRELTRALGAHARTVLAPPGPGSGPFGPV